MNLFDTGEAARVLCLEGKGLKFLLEKYVGVEADKKYQLEDWRWRPLPEDMLKYAWEDTHYLLYIYDCLRKDLLAAAVNQPPQTFLITVWKWSQALALTVYEKPKVKDMEFYRAITWKETALDPL